MAEVDHSVRVARAIFIAALVGNAACSGHLRNAISGSTVQNKIDDAITGNLRAYDPSLKVAPSKCEPIIIRRTRTMGTCELNVNGDILKIRVAGAGPPDYFTVDYGGASFYEMARVERFARNDLDRNFHIRGQVDCGSPRIRLIEPEIVLTCSVAAAPRLQSIKLKTLANGNVFAYNPPGLKSSSPLPVGVLTLHKQGKSSIAKGSDIERFISDGLSANPTSTGRKLVPACPPSMDLTGRKQGVCILRVPGASSPQRLAIWIDEAVGLRVRPIDAVINRERVETLAQTDLNSRLMQNGDAPDALVVCQKGLLVTQPPSTFDCQASAGGKRYTLQVLVHDSAGTVSWRGIARP